MGVVAEMADRVLVMNDGRVIETGPVERIFTAPQEDYTRKLLAAVPQLGSMAGRDLPRRTTGRPERGPPLIEVGDLTVRFDIRSGFLQRTTARVHAVEGISFSLAPRETLSLVGESGCGKSTTGKAIMGLVERQGSIRVEGRETVGMDRAGLKAVRRNVQMIFQDPGAALDPRMTVGKLVGEPLVIHGLASGSELEDRVAWLFGRVGLSPEQMRRHPHEFSGGQRQRICIARALSLSPKAIIADESVSALDVSVQAQVLDLMQEIQDEFGLSYLFISHDMAVVEEISHRIAVMFLGQIVEIGSRRQIFEDPRHPYTRRLLAAVPIADPTRRRGRTERIEGEVPSPIRRVGDEPRRLPLVEVDPGHFVVETHAEVLDLAG
jgi:peptide/nickel transport system ATP-binding protein